MAALGLSVGISVAIVWIAIAASYETDWPVGFFVGVLGAVFFVAGRGWAAWHRSAPDAGTVTGSSRRDPSQLATAVGMRGEAT